MGQSSKSEKVVKLTEGLGLKIKDVRHIVQDVNVIKRPEKPVYYVNNADKVSILAKKLVPDARIDDEYSEDILKENLAKICEAQGCGIKGFGEYTSALNEILVAISTGTLRKSYIIGSPNGFGKTTFANTCIKRLDKMGYRAVPYISLFELAELRMIYERMLLGYLKKRVEKDEEDTDDSEEFTYTWRDYLRADVVFTYLTILENKKIETAILKALLDIRGPKGLPTIVFTSSSLVPYLNDVTLKKVIWDDILAYSDDCDKADRLIHKACFKIYNSSIVINGE